MSRQAEARARQTAAVYPCAERCGRTADYRCELRHLEPRRVECRKGVDAVVEPYATTYLCEACCKARLQEADPPPARRGPASQGQDARRRSGRGTCRGARPARGAARRPGTSLVTHQGGR